MDPDGRDIVYVDGDGQEVTREISDRNEIYTPESDLELLRNNALELEKRKADILYFYNNVKTGGRWDYKNKKNQSYRSYYWFNNELVTAEDFGNINYGYVGAVGGFSLDLLIDAPGIVQVKQNTAEASFFLTNFDDPKDTMNIYKGFSEYTMPLSTLLLCSSMNFIYNFSGMRNGFRGVTALYFLGKQYE